MKNFYEFLDKAIKQERNLDYFCFFCRTLWSSSSVHCMTCQRCVEGFDHHCPFMNNCIGYKNHGSFLLFLLFSFFYTIAVLGEAVWSGYRAYHICNEVHYYHHDMDQCDGYRKAVYYSVCGVFLMITILQSVPALGQCCKQIKFVSQKKGEYKIQ